MSPAEMEQLCLNSMTGAKDFGGTEDTAVITLVTPKGWKAPSKFPRGYLLQVKDDGSRLWHFKSKRVLQWLRSQAGDA
ncbi:hypothetical protein QWJ46_00570 [Rhizobium sp. CBN3]|uniref:hypothetical protein n=1 Tax=Rhizobium sp. CBN3 TaxID=3058045 RepID=UPI002673029F|nr:hypothetical protein [Rhizobium sp. CBN3]MDO3431167.1 hypothetical protein [Rhizobium sp. CBN3]